MNLFDKVKMYKKVTGDSAFPKNPDSSSQEGAISWAGRGYREFLIPNEFTDIKLLSLSYRGNGGRAYKVELEHDSEKYIVDLREDTLMYVLKNLEVNKGIMKGTFAFIQKGNQVNLYEKSSPEYLELFQENHNKETTLRLEKIKHSDLIPYKIYLKEKDYLLYLKAKQSKESSNYRFIECNVYLGKVFVRDFNNKKEKKYKTMYKFLQLIVKPSCEGNLEITEKYLNEALNRTYSYKIEHQFKGVSDVALDENTLDYIRNNVKTTSQISDLAVFELLNSYLFESYFSRYERESKIEEEIVRNYKKILAVDDKNNFEYNQNLKKLFEPTNFNL